ncbi:MAG: hypothetical protein ABEH65_09345, partial [Halobacteriales archaeon]
MTIAIDPYGVPILPAEQLIDRDFKELPRQIIFVVGHVEHVVAKHDRLFGTRIRVFLPLYLRRLLVGCRV